MKKKKQTRRQKLRVPKEKQKLFVVLEKDNSQNVVQVAAIKHESDLRIIKAEVDEMIDASVTENKDCSYAIFEGQAIWYDRDNRSALKKKASTRRVTKSKEASDGANTSSR